LQPTALVDDGSRIERDVTEGTHEQGRTGPQTQTCHHATGNKIGQTRRAEGQPMGAMPPTFENAARAGRAEDHEAEAASQPASILATRDYFDPLSTPNCEPSLRKRHSRQTWRRSRDRLRASWVRSWVYRGSLLFDDVIWANPVAIGLGRLRIAPRQPSNGIGALGVLLFAYLKLKLRLQIAATTRNSSVRLAHQPIAARKDLATRSRAAGAGHTWSLTAWAASSPALP